MWRWIVSKQSKQYSDKVRRKVVRKVLDEGQDVLDVARVCGVPVRLVDD